jgi:hypothetical protein
MKNVNLKLKLAIGLTLLATLSPFKTFAEGGISGGGGKPLEAVFQEVASNILQWIEAGNSAGLKLPNGFTNEDYVNKMKPHLNNYQIKITSDIILVDGVEKDCENITHTNQPSEIKCNEASLYLVLKNANLLYRLVHHEFAALAGLEVAQGSKSDYYISNQLSAFLRVETVLRLPIVKEDSKAQDEDLFVTMALNFIEARFPNKPDAEPDMRYYYRVLTSKPYSNGVRTLVQVWASPEFEECYLITTSYSNSFSSSRRKCPIRSYEDIVVK